jgi:hypothetical protein
MSEETTEVLQQDELSTLKARADLLGISYHPSIGVEKLREKLAAALEGGAEETKNEGTGIGAPVESEAQKRLRLMQEATKLVRIRVTCMNPAKKEWEGEIITVGNAGVGTYKKYIPFNADEGWHVPNIIYQALQERQCQVFVSTKTKNGVTIRQGKLIKEFAIEVLPPLTEEELKDLAQRQAMSKSVG